MEVFLPGCFVPPETAFKSQILLLDRAGDYTKIGCKMFSPPNRAAVNLTKAIINPTGKDSAVASPLVRGDGGLGWVEGLPEVLGINFRVSHLILYACGRGGSRLDAVV